MYVISCMCIHMSAFIHVLAQSMHTDFFTHVLTEHMHACPCTCAHRKHNIHALICMHTDTGMQRVPAHSNSQGVGPSSLSTGHCLKLRRLREPNPVPQKKPS